VNFLRVILATLVIFATGALSGYFVARKSGAVTQAPPAAKSVLASTNAPSGWNKSREEMRASLQKELNATDEQMAKVDEILSQSRKRSREIWQTMRGSMESEIERVKEEIRGVLDAAQAAKYEEIMKHRGPGGGHKKEKATNGQGDPKACWLNYLQVQQYCL
jgi:Spy/CpxP family protein refolding chaperone